MIQIAAESPLTEDLALLFQRHTADMHADTPPESIHMLDRAELAGPGIAFFVLRDAGQPLAMGAIKRWNGATGSMYRRPSQLCVRTTVLTSTSHRPGAVGRRIRAMCTSR